MNKEQFIASMKETRKKREAEMKERREKTYKSFKEMREAMIAKAKAEQEKTSTEKIEDNNESKSE